MLSPAGRREVAEIVERFQRDASVYLSTPATDAALRDLCTLAMRAAREVCAVVPEVPPPRTAKAFVDGPSRLVRLWFVGEDSDTLERLREAGLAPERQDDDLCPQCGGSGGGSGPLRCPSCRGLGTVPVRDDYQD